MQSVEETKPLTALVLLTGGTIAAEAYMDPENPPLNATVTHNGRVKDALDELSKLKVYQLEVRDYGVQDSKALTEDDITKWAQQIATYAETQTGSVNILITHGTDRMVYNAIRLDGHETIQALRNAGVELNIGVTGAWTPLANGGTYAEKAKENLRTALDGMRDEEKTKHSATFVAMDGHYHDPYNCYKDFQDLKLKPLDHILQQVNDKIPPKEKEAIKDTLQEYGISGNYTRNLVSHLTEKNEHEQITPPPPTRD